MLITRPRNAIGTVQTIGKRKKSREPLARVWSGRDGIMVRGAQDEHFLAQNRNDPPIVATLSHMDRWRNRQMRAPLRKQENIANETTAAEQPEGNDSTDKALRGPVTARKKTAFAMFSIAR